MAETTNVRLLHQSAHEVAYQLMQDVMSAENTVTHQLSNSSNSKRADREYLLKLFYDCRRVVLDGVDPARK